MTENQNDPVDQMQAAMKFFVEMQKPAQEAMKLFADTQMKFFADAQRPAQEAMKAFAELQKPALEGMKAFAELQNAAQQAMKAFAEMQNSAQEAMKAFTEMHYEHRSPVFYRQRISPRWSTCQDFLAQMNLVLSMLIG